MHFALETCFAPGRRAIFRHPHFQKWSEHFNLERCFAPQRRALFYFSSRHTAPRPLPRIIGKPQCFYSPLFCSSLLYSSLCLYFPLLFIFPFVASLSVKLLSINGEGNTSNGNSRRRTSLNAEPRLTCTWNNGQRLYSRTQKARK